MPLPGINSRLLTAIAVTNVGAAAAVVLAMWFTEGLSAPSAWTLRAVLGILILAVWISVLNRRIRDVVHVPLQRIIDSAEAVAAGDTTHRAPRGTTAEFQALSTSINRMTDQLLEADKARGRVEKLATMGRLAAGISHEIGNPLAALANYTHVTRMRAGSAAALTEPLDAMEREIARIDSIMRGLLDYARPKKVTPRPVVVDDVVHDVVRLLSDQGVLRRTNLKQQLHAPDAVVHGERHDVEQLLVNLLLNAIDATDTDGTVVVGTRVIDTERIKAVPPSRNGEADEMDWAHQPSTRALEWTSRAEHRGKVLQVVIADSGVGVAPEDEERIFEPFFTTKVPGKGTGLGLAIVASTVESLGGTIWSQPAREGGAAFIILLPLNHTPASGVAPVQPA